MVERKQEKQCINKLWNLKDLYKKAKENNCTSGSSPETSFFSRRFPWDTLREENKLGRKECGIKDWTFKIGKIVELKIVNGQSIAWIAELKNAKKDFWVENNEFLQSNCKIT